MAGTGMRFLNAGYTVPKPLILIEGKPIIEHVVNRFSLDDEFIFGCNQEHLQSTNMTATLKKIAPKNKIISMPYKKEGPIYGLNRMISSFVDDEPVIVNYCDFSWVWDYEDFKRRIKESNCDGAVVCYKGFHPHLLGNNKYATLDADGHWMKEIREKHSWHKSKMEDWSSSGTYYFKKGIDLKKYLKQIESRPEWKINGEFYVSQLFQLMKEDNLNILIYEIPYMLQWGTPEDLEEYNYWSEYFHFNKGSEQISPSMRMDVLIPMAGEGKRFSQEGYTLPKPLIEIDNIPMIIKATNDLPKGNRYIFVMRDEHCEQYRVDNVLKSYIKGTEIIKINYLTEGQASTALMARELINKDLPLMIGACDNGMLYNVDEFMKLTSSDSNIDALIFTFRNNPTVMRNPNMYGWVSIDKNKKAIKVSVKIPISKEPINDHAVVGAFWFKKGKYFLDNAEEMIRLNDKINNEFYIDNCMNYLIRKGLHVAVFEVDKYVCWGTPNDLKTYEYWQRYFNRSSESKLKLKT